MQFCIKTEVINPQGLPGYATRQSLPSPLLHNHRPGEAHAETVIGVTYRYHITLVMCRYSASSKSEARQALLPERLEFIRAGGASSPVKTNKVGKATKANIHAAEQSRSTTGPHRCPTTSMFGLFRAAITTPKLREFSYLKTATTAVLR